MFHGYASENVRDFIHRLDTLFQVAGINNNLTKINFAISYMDGVAKRWADITTNNYGLAAGLRHPTWDNFTADLLQRFTDPAVVYSDRLACNTRNQEEGESVEDYLQVMSNMASKAGLDDQTLFGALQRGFLPYIRAKLVSARPANLLELTSKAKLIEMARELKKTKYKSVMVADNEITSPSMQELIQAVQLAQQPLLRSIEALTEVLQSKSQ